MEDIVQTQIYELIANSITGDYLVNETDINMNKTNKLELDIMELISSCVIVSAMKRQKLENYYRLENHNYYTSNES